MAVSVEKKRDTYHHGDLRSALIDGRRGRPVKKPRFIPAELAHQLARKLLARRLGTISVI